MSESRVFVRLPGPKTHRITPEPAPPRLMPGPDLRRAWEREGKRRSASDAALAPDSPTMGFDGALRDRKSEPHPPMVTISRLPEIVEEVFDLRRLYSGACINHPYDYALVFRGSLESHSSIGWSELDRVAHDVSDDL